MQHLQAWLESRWWDAQRPPPALLRPLSALFARIAQHRARTLNAKAERLPVPVIVVGNIAVGGSGKTPVTLYLLDVLKNLGYTPGVLSRGYGGRGPFPLLVTANTPATACGDEPLLIATRSGMPICVAPKRAEAGRALLAAYPKTNVLVCDDGLQHYALARDIEIAVIDGARWHGNGALLPAGPLREPPSRLDRCDIVLVNGGTEQLLSTQMRRFSLPLGAAWPLSGGTAQALSAFMGKRIHAVAGIGHPPRFFDALRAAGLGPIVEHPFPDHHPYVAADFAGLGDDGVVLMTEKDAVKCKGLGLAKAWAVPAGLAMTAADAACVRQSLRSLLPPPA